MVTAEQKVRCWICDQKYQGEHCPICGPEQPWGPTAEELQREAAEAAERAQGWEPGMDA